MNVLVGIAIIGTIVLGAIGDREAWIDGCVLVSKQLFLQMTWQLTLVDFPSGCNLPDGGTT